MVSITIKNNISKQFKDNDTGTKSTVNYQAYKDNAACSTVVDKDTLYQYINILLKIFSFFYKQLVSDTHVISYSACVSVFYQVCPHDLKL